MTNGTANLARKHSPALGLAILQDSKLLAVRGVGGCRHSCRPKPLREYVESSSDNLVELVVLQPTAHPSCLLPLACPLSEVVAELHDLHQLHPDTVCPTLTRLSAYMQQAPAAEIAALRDWPAFISLLERSLEIAGERWMGPAVPVQLLCVLSLLRFDDDDQLCEGYTAFGRLLANALEDACKREGEGLTPQAILCAYESWARINLDCPPLKATAFTARVRHAIKHNALSVEESARLLCAKASILRSERGGFNASSYDVSALVARVGCNLGELGGLQLEELAWACGGYAWPVQLLDSLSQEAVQRLAHQTIHRSLGNAVLSTAVRAAHALRPRLRQELQSRIADWAAEADHAASTRLPAGTHLQGRNRVVRASDPWKCVGVWDGVLSACH